jgi:hypothetical protein
LLLRMPSLVLSRTSYKIIFFPIHFLEEHDIQKALPTNSVSSYSLQMFHILSAAAAASFSAVHFCLGDFYTSQCMQTLYLNI